MQSIPLPPPLCIFHLNNVVSDCCLLGIENVSYRDVGSLWISRANCPKATSKDTFSMWMDKGKQVHDRRRFFLSHLRWNIGQRMWQIVAVENEFQRPSCHRSSISSIYPSIHPLTVIQGWCTRFVKINAFSSSLCRNIVVKCTTTTNIGLATLEWWPYSPMPEHSFDIRRLLLENLQ